MYVSLIVLNIGGMSVVTSTAIGKMMINKLAGIAEFKADMIRERQIEGIAEAKARGVYKGRLSTYTEKHGGLQHAIELYKNRHLNSYTVKQIANITKISKATIYRAAKEKEVQY